jgi:hypothetical protein
MATATLSSQESTANAPAKAGAQLRRGATDDEILGIEIGAAREASATKGHRIDSDLNKKDPKIEATSNQDHQAVSEKELPAVLDANPELRSAWEDAAAYRKTFATPEEAQSASTRLADLDRLDALFFSRKPEDHAELARAVAALDPDAFNSLVAAMTQLAGSKQGRAQMERAEGTRGRISGLVMAGVSSRDFCRRAGSGAKITRIWIGKGG